MSDAAKWTEWAEKLKALAQNGLTYTQNPFDIERYHELRQLAAQMAAHHVGAPPSAIVDLFSKEEGYATPKVDVRGAVFKDDAILLAREKSDGKWTLPGGWADVRESPSTSVVREIFEETGYDTNAVKLLAVLDRALHGHQPPMFHTVYKLVFRCDLVGGTPTPSATEILEVGFFRESELPELSLARTTPATLARVFEHLRNPEWPTDFD